MLLHPHDYARLVAERHAQIQRDMQLSRQRKPRAAVQPEPVQLDTHVQEGQTHRVSVDVSKRTLRNVS